ncbi:MAG: pyrroline-5-carboxylate reductase family protein, partial [Granulosicoccaceae bacterium]
MVLGFLGVGHLASYTIEGLRHAGDRRRIVLSPRNSAVAAELVERHGCELAEHNQAVIDSCEAVVLSVRPDSVADLLSDVQFKSGQLVISVMAGVSLRDLQKHSNLCDVVLVRSLPIQCAAVGVGPLPLYPGNAVAGEIGIADNVDKLLNATRSG